MLKIQDHAVLLFKKRTKTPLLPNGVQQAVKALTAFLGNIEPLDLTLSINNFVSLCNEISNIQVTYKQIKACSLVNVFNIYRFDVFKLISCDVIKQDVYGSRTEVIADDGSDYSVVNLKFNETEKVDHITNVCLKIKESVQLLIENYCKAFKVNFQLNFHSSQLTGTQTNFVYLVFSN